MYIVYQGGVGTLDDNGVEGDTGNTVNTVNKRVFLKKQVPL